MAVAARIGDADHAAVGQADAGRALDVDHEGLDRAAEEHDRPGARSQRAVLDGGPVWIRLVAGVRAPRGLERWIEAGKRFSLRHGHEISGPGQEGRREPLRRFERARVLRLEVAGQKTLAAWRDDPCRLEAFLEKVFRGAAAGVAQGQRRRAGPPQPRIRRLRGPQTRLFGGDRRAGPAKGFEGRRMVVLGPAREIRESQRLKPGVPRGRHRLGPQLQHGGDERGENRETGPPRADWPGLGATSCQLGSRVPSARANVHTSVTSTTASGLPSTTLPAASRVAVISLERKRTVICATRFRASTPAISALSIDTKVVSAFSPRRSRSVIARSKPSKTSRDKRFFKVLRSPRAKAVTIIS